MAGEQNFSGLDQKILPCMDLQAFFFCFKSTDKPGDHGSHALKLKKSTQLKKPESPKYNLERKLTRDSCVGWIFYG